MAEEPTPVVTKVVTSTRSLSLDERQVAKIMVEWAKTQGFSHRATIDACCHQGEFVGMEIIETTTLTTEDLN